ncbi:MAG: 50S ribosomal protein L25 [Candidatus Yanofskybacteria bacterium]|nr:50S ribosomal protein L25 [Candidatus Yanofskybacteria bacterium]
MSLQAEPRTIKGRGVKALREESLLPAVIYGHDFESVSIQVSLKDFERVYAEAGESTVVYVKMNGQDYPTIIHGIARDPVGDGFLHADFYKVRLDEKIKASIHLNFMGESPAVKNLGGILVKNMSEIEVEGFPQDLPSQIEVDVSSLVDFGSEIMVKNLAISSKLEVKKEPDAIVALIQEPMSEEELKAQFEAPIASAEDVEVIKKEKPEEEAAEGEEAPKEEAK